MFEDIMAMRGNYDDRKVGRDDYEWGFISTAYVNDGECDYETAVKHEDYDDGNMVIVDKYETKEDAEKGHKKWIETMKNPPNELVDCANSLVSKMCSTKTFKRKKNPKGKS